jgi:hypothetical protein
MGYCSPAEFAFCDDACRRRFDSVVERLENGEALKEIGRRRVRQYTEDRQYAEDQYLRNRPRNLPSVAKRYFS